MPAFMPIEIKNWLELPYFPRTNEDRVRYALAMARCFFFENIAEKRPPLSPENPILLSGSSEIQVKYLWTAFMLYGSELSIKGRVDALFAKVPENYGFDHKAIIIPEKYAFDYKKELGYFYRFSSSSLYERKFKPVMNKLDIKLSRRPAVLKRFCDETPVFTEQFEIIKLELEPKEIREAKLKAKEEAKIKAKEEAERKAKEEAERKAKEEAERKAKEEAKKEAFKRKRREEIQAKNILTYERWITEELCENAGVLKRDLKLYIEKHGVNPTVILKGAIIANNEGIAEYLIRHHGADPSQIGDRVNYISTSSPLYELIKEKKFQKLLSSFQELKNDASDTKKQMIQEGNELLLTEVTLLNAKIRYINILLKIGVNINFQNKEGYTPLMLAAESSNEQICEYLLKMDANPLLKNIFGQTARYFVPSNSSLANLLKKYEKKYRLKKLTPKEKYSILLNDYVGNISVQISKIEKYLKLGADIDYINIRGDSTLMVALDFDNETAVDFLLRRGANPFLKNHNGRKPSDIVSRDSLMYQKLKGYELLYATLNQDLSTVDILLRSNITIIDFQGEYGYTALHIAIEEEFVELVKYLLEAGASISICNDNGDNAFDLAISHKIKSIITPYLNMLTDNTFPNPGNSINADVDKQNSSFSI